MACTRLNAESATRKVKAYSSSWTTSITFYMGTGQQALVMFNQSRLYSLWNNPTELLKQLLSGDALTGLTVSRDGYPGNVTLSWTGNSAVTVLLI